MRNVLFHCHFQRTNNHISDFITKVKPLSLSISHTHTHTHQNTIKGSHQGVVVAETKRNMLDNLNDIQQAFRNKREVIHESKEINELAMNPINKNIGDQH
jgi:hypothetical protein